MNQEHLRTHIPLPLDRPVRGRGRLDNLPYRWLFGLRKIGLLPAALVGRKSIGNRPRSSLPDAALDTGELLKRAIDRSSITGIRGRPIGLARRTRFPHNGVAGPRDARRCPIGSLGCSLLVERNEQGADHQSSHEKQAPADAKPGDDRTRQGELPRQRQDSSKGRAPT